MLESILTLAVAALFLLGSPGPVTISLAANGAVYGPKKSIPYFWGIIAGLLSVILVSSLGLASLFELYPTSKTVFQVIGTTYLLFIAYKIAGGPALTSSEQEAVEAPNFRDGFLLNLFNAKAYAVFMALFTQFLIPTESQQLSYFLTALTAFCVAFLVDVAWLQLGGLLQNLFMAPKTARLMRLTFAGLMLLAVAMTIV